MNNELIFNNSFSLIIIFNNWKKMATACLNKIKLKVTNSVQTRIDTMDNDNRYNGSIVTRVR